MASIITRNGREVAVDDCDLLIIAGYSWTAVAPDKDCPHRFYAMSSKYSPEKKGQRTVWMHRLIMSAPKGKQVDHVDRDGLNNRRENLRLCSQSQNNANRSVPQGTGGYRGVFLVPSGKYRASITNGKRTGARVQNLGTYKTAEEAARAYDAAAHARFGEFATLNFNNSI